MTLDRTLNSCSSRLFNKLMDFTV